MTPSTEKLVIAVLKRQAMMWAEIGKTFADSNDHRSVVAGEARTLVELVNLIEMEGRL